ncbi:MAG: hypothetical protein ACN4GM_16205 [Gammaproteobacteria bacterium]
MFLGKFPVFQADVSWFNDFVIFEGILGPSKKFAQGNNKMNKLTTVTLGGLLAVSMSSAAYAEPTRTFFAETADVATKGSVSLDLEYEFEDIGGGTGIRIGGMGGEILLNNTQYGVDETFYVSSLGYKKVIQKNLAVYGILSYYNGPVQGPGPGPAADESFTDFAIGVAYTLKQKLMTININGEIITDDSGTLRGDETTVFVKGAIKFPINNLLDKSSLIAEVAVEDNDTLDTASAFGLRWEPSSRVTTDLIIYVDNGVDDIIGIPGYIKLNLAF